MKSSKVRCPNPQCHLTLTIPEEMFGQQVRCAGCGQSFTAPISRADRQTIKKIRRYRKAS